MDNAEVCFFGYGVYRDLNRISKVIGVQPKIYRGGIIHGYHLYYQGIEQIPDPPKTILVDVWGKDFKAYTIHPGKGIVVGTLWQLTTQHLEKIKEWEFDGIWRQLVTVQVETFDGETIDAFTDKAINSHQNNGCYDGINYILDLNSEREIFTDTEKINDNVDKMEKLETLRKSLAMSTR